MPDDRSDVRELLRLAVPAAASALLSTAHIAVDQRFVRPLGTAAQAAVGSCVFVAIAAFSLFALVSAGTGPVVARATGAGDLALRRRAVGNALTGVVGIGVLVLGAIGLLADPIVGLLGLTGPTADDAAVYLRGYAAAGLPLALGPVMDAAFVAMGNARVPMALQGLTLLLKIALVGPCVDALGVTGAPLSTGLARGASVLIGIVVLWRQVRPARSDLVPDRTLGRIARVGLPITANSLAYTLVYWVLLKVAISPLGPEVNAALGIGFGVLEGTTYPVFLGVSLAVASMVGRRLGAGRPDLAAQAVRAAFPVSTAVGLAASLAFAFGARPVCGLFTSDPAALEQAVIYARVLAWSQVFVAWESLVEGVLEGSGCTRTVLAWAAPLNALRVPLGWWLAGPLGWGAAGVWWAINATTYAKAAGKAWSVRQGAWQRKEV